MKIVIKVSLQHSVKMGKQFEVEREDILADNDYFEQMTGLVPRRLLEKTQPNEPAETTTDPDPSHEELSLKKKKHKEKNKFKHKEAESLTNHIHNNTDTGAAQKKNKIKRKHSRPSESAEDARSCASLEVPVHELMSEESRDSVQEDTPASKKPKKRRLADSESPIEIEDPLPTHTHVPISTKTPIKGANGIEESPPRTKKKKQKKASGSENGEEPQTPTTVTTAIPCDNYDKTSPVARGDTNTNQKVGVAGVAPVTATPSKPMADPGSGGADRKKAVKLNRKKEEMKLKRAEVLKKDALDGSPDSSLTAVKGKKARLEVQDSSSSLVSTGCNGANMGVDELTCGILSLEDKRAKLRAKIEELQAKRNINDKEKMNRKKLKRQESKMKLKQRRKQEKLMKTKQTENGGSVGKGGNSSATVSPVKPVYNKEGEMVFSKFDFSGSSKKNKEDKKHELHGKDYKRLLEKIEKRNEKIQKVKSKDVNAAKSLEEKFKWESVLHKAEGQKVKDNPELLKKALKRKEKIKQHKQKKWEDRTQTVKKLQDAKIKTRNENIQKRKQANKDKKIKKLTKKGRILPGF